MPLLHLEALPAGCTKSQLFKMLIEEGEANKLEIGTILLQRRKATIELPENNISRIAKKLQQNQPAIIAWVEQSEREIHPHFLKLCQLLELEAKAEAEQLKQSLETEAKVSQLKVQDQWVTLGDKVTITLSLKNPGQNLADFRFRAGSPVLVVSESDSADARRGVVAKVKANQIEIVCQDFLESEDQYSLCPSPDEITRSRQKTALLRASSAQGNRMAELRDILLEPKSSSFSQNESDRYEYGSLNQTQNDAIQHALSAEHVAIIHGPPGTGKTVTLAHLIQAAVSRKHKVLACAPSNLAVDNLLEKLLNQGVKAVRLGHPIRVSAALQQHTLELLIHEHPETKLANKFVKEAQKLLRQAGRFTRAKPAAGEKQALREEARELLNDAARVQQQTLEHLLDEADVLCVTLTGVDDDLLGSRQFDMCVIDEACQSIEPACWIPITRANKVVLAGDHCQLPPTILSDSAKQQGLEISMQQRMLADNPALAKQLIVQYRMHQKIMGFSSDQFYEGSLIADQSVANRTLDTITAESLDDSALIKPVQFFDTAGAGFEECQSEFSASRFNEQEAKLVNQLVQLYLDQGIAPEFIGVLTPYRGQVKLIRSLLPEMIEVDSIDGFQGREQELVICSMVRSNFEQQIGFLGDIRRMNVAMTRAKCKLIMIGDSATIGGFPFYEELLKYFEKVDAYHTVWEMME